MLVMTFKMQMIMKKIVSLILFAGCIFGVVSCQKETLDQNTEEPSGKTVRMILNATQDNSTKTVLYDGTKVKWKDTDKVTVMYKKNSGSGWYSQESSSGSLSDSDTKASFTVELSDPNTSTSAYAIYPANDLVQSETDKAKITIAATQHPTSTSYDGASDIMISKPFTPAGSVTTQFSRPGAVLKIKINNASLSSEKLLSLSVTGANDLAGDVLVNLDDASVYGIENGSTTVTAEYESENQFTVGSGYYVYLIVKPQTLANGSTLTVEGETENYTFSKAIALSQDIHLNAGHVVPLRISDLDDVSLKSKTFFAARFDENTGTGGNDGSWSGNSTATSSIQGVTDWIITKGSGAYRCIKLGISNDRGSATTPSITIPNAYSAVTLSFKAGAWDNGAAKTLNLSATNAVIKNETETETVSSVSMACASWTAYTLHLTNITGDVALTFSANNASKNQFFLDEVLIYYGSTPKKDAGISYAVSKVIKSVSDENFTLTLSNPELMTVAYSSSNTSVATIDSETGEVDILTAGTTRITASTVEDSHHLAGSVYYDLCTNSPVTSFSWSRSGSTDTYNTGFTLSSNMVADSGLYKENSTVQDYYLTFYHPTVSLFSSTPFAIKFMVRIGGSTNKNLDSPVYACLTDETGTAIDGTEVEITSTIIKEGSDYEVEIPSTASAYGIKLYHAKQSSYNINIYSYSLKYYPE